jgi:apolipoprotein D and lipocalin family protein
LRELNVLARRAHGLCRLVVAGLILGVMASCAKAPVGQSFRPPDKAIYSNASFDLSRLRGSWQQVAGFADEAGCNGGVATFAEDAAGGVMGEAQLCVAGQMRGWSGPVTRVGPGRFTIGAGEPWWVLWDDADNRTLVIGTPSGAFGFVLDRSGDLPRDRMVAAREILDFNGYDLSRLRRD